MLRSKSEPNKCTKCVHGCRTQSQRSLKKQNALLKNNTVQCAAAAREYVLRPVCSTTYGRVHISEFLAAKYLSTGTQVPGTIIVPGEK